MRFNMGVYKLASCIVRDGALDVADAVGWTVRLAATLEIIHRVGAAHGRISPKAIQVLGTSYQAGGFVLDTPDLVDDAAYQSPERLEGGQPSPADDTWAVAVLLYECLTGRVPFAGTTGAQVMANILQDVRAPVADFGIASPRLQLVIDECLRKDQAVRITSVRVLKERLISCAPECEDLPPLKLGKPDLALFEESTDDDGEKLTAVLENHPAILQARLQHAAMKAAIKAAKAKTASASAPADPESTDTRIVQPSPEMEAEVARAAAQAEALLEEAAPGPPTEEIPPPPSSKWPDLAGATGGAPQLPGLTESNADWESSSDRAVHRATPSTPSDLRAAPSSSGRLAAMGRDSYAAPSSSGRLPAAASVRAPATRRQRKSTWVRDFVLSLLFLSAGGVAAYYLYGHDDGEDAVQPDTAAPREKSSAAPTGTTTASSAASGTTAAAPTGAATESGTATAAPTTEPTGSSAVAPASAVAQCMKPLFPKGTFAYTTPYFDFVCTETDAREGGSELRVQVIRSGGGRRGVTSGMREWSRLGWYEMAAFAVLREVCCDAPPPLKTKQAIDRCPLDKSLQALADATIAGSDSQVERALGNFTKVVHCMVRAGASRTFGQRGMPGGSAARVFRRTLARARLRAKTR